MELGSARKQRAGLLLTNINGRKTVFVACGTIQETAANARGWVIASGRYELLLGASSRAIRSRVPFSVPVDTPLAGR